MTENTQGSFDVDIWFESLVELRKLKGKETVYKGDWIDLYRMGMPPEEAAQLECESVVQNPVESGS